MLELNEIGSLGLLCIFSTVETIGACCGGGGAISCCDGICGCIGAVSVFIAIFGFTTFNFAFLVMGFGAGDSLSPCEICGDRRFIGFFSLSVGDVV